jgi:hypothetical protein
MEFWRTVGWSVKELCVLFSGRAEKNRLAAVYFFTFFALRRIFFGLGARVILPVALYSAMALLIISLSSSVKGMGSTTKSTPFGSLTYPIFILF